MDIGAAIKTFETVVTIAKPIIEVVAPKLQESMKDFSERLLVLSEKYPSLEDFAQMINKVADVLGDVLYALGVSADPADELGMKVAQSDKKIDDFDSISEYITYLKEEVELDKEKFDSLSEEERIAYSITGLAVEAGAIGEQIGVELPAESMELLSALGELSEIIIEAKEVITILKSLKESGIINLNEVSECISGEGESDRLVTSDALVEAFDSISEGNGEVILDELENKVRG